MQAQFIPAEEQGNILEKYTTNINRLARSEERRVGKECYICGVDLGGRRIIQAEDGIRDSVLCD